MHNRKVQVLYTTERKMLWGAFSFILLASALYMYLLCASVAHVVARKEIGQEIASISSEIGIRESEYIAAQHAVSVDIASLHGFTLAESKTFVKPTQTTFVLSKNNDS